MMRPQYQNSTPPVVEGEEIDVTIEAVGEKGDGIARKEGFVLFIPGVKTGDRVKIRITRVLPKVGFAEKIGEGAPAPVEEKPARQEKQSEPDFDPQPELDSEDFGDDSDDSSGDDEDPDSEESQEDAEDDVANSEDDSEQKKE